MERFFQAFTSYAMGSLPLQDLEARIGPSPSGVAGVYESVVLKNVGYALAAMYSGTKRGCHAVATDLWDRVANDFCTQNPPRHPDPNQWAAPFAEFLSRRRPGDVRQPAFVEELADYERIRFRAFTSPLSGPEETIFVRRYTHAVPAYVEETIGHGCSHPDSGPLAAAVTVIVFRSTWTLKTHFLYPSGAQLLALARHWGELEEDLRAQAGVSSEALAHAEADLRTAGVLPKEQL